MSEDKRAGYIKNFPNHVPMFRKFDENEDKNFGDSLKAMTGSSRDVIDPLNSIIKNTYDFVRRAEKNKAKILLAVANQARRGTTRLRSLMRRFRAGINSSGRMTRVNIGRETPKLKRVRYDSACVGKYRADGVFLLVEYKRRR